MKRILVIALLLTSAFSMARGRIQDADVKSANDLKTSIATITGNLSSGTDCIASPSSLTGLAVGQYLYDLTTAANIPSGTTIAALPGTCSSGQIQMSANAAGTATGDSIGVGAPLTQLLNDSKIWMTSVTPPQQLSTAVTAGLIGGGGGNSGKNYLSNSSFEGGATGWTVAGGSTAVNTSDFHDGAQSITITPSAAGSFLQSVTPATNLKGSNIESGLWVKTTKTDVENCSYINAVEIECQKVAAIGEWVYVPANAAGPAQGTSIGVKLKWGSTGGSILVDMGYVGGATNLTQIAQAKPIGTLKYSAAASCTWDLTSASYTGFSADTDCSTPTVTGNLQAPATKIPAFKMNVTAGSIYRITAKSNFNAMVGFSSFRFNDGTDSSELAGGSFGSFGTVEGYVGSITAIYTPTTSGLKTIEIQAKAPSSNSRIITDVADLVFEVEQFPSQSQLAVNSLQSDYGPLAYTPTFTGFGTVTNISATHYKKGKFLYVDGFATAGTCTATPGLISLPSGLTIDSTTWSGSVHDAGRIINAGDVTVTFSHYLMFRPATSVTDVLVTRRYGTNSDAPHGVQNITDIGPCANNFTFNFKVPIAGWFDSQRSPTLVGSVTSGAENALRFEAVSISDTGVISSESSDWINGNCTNANPRVCTINSGVFSIAPVCVATGTDPAAAPDTWPTIQAISTTSISIFTNSHLPGFANVSNQRPVNLMCMGAR